MRLALLLMFTLGLLPPAAQGLTKEVRGPVLFLGSSSISSWQKLEQDFPDVQTINKGIADSKLTDVAATVGGLVDALRPRLLVVYAGENDLYAGASSETLCQTYRVFVESLRVPLVYISIKPSPSRWDTLRDAVWAANSCMRTVTMLRKNAKYVDVYSKMLDTRGEPRLELFGPDLLHMNGSGYRLWRDALKPMLK